MQNYLLHQIGNFRTKTPSDTLHFALLVHKLVLPVTNKIGEIYDFKKII